VSQSTTMLASRTLGPWIESECAGLLQYRAIERCAMPTFAFWYAVFLFGGAVGAMVGATFESGLAGLLGGMALSGWSAQQLSSNRASSSLKPETLLIQPPSGETWAKNAESLQFTAAHPGSQKAAFIAAVPDPFGPLPLPKGMHAFAMRKRAEKQTVEIIPPLPARPGVRARAPVFRSHSGLRLPSSTRAA
jgi:hypothetical protein